MVLRPGHGVGQNQFIGARFAISSIAGRFTFFTTTGTGTQTQSTNQLWTQETVGRVLLVLEPTAVDWQDGGNNSKQYLDARNMYAGPNGGNSLGAADDYVNCFHNLASRDNFKVLKAWDFELSTGSSGQEASYRLAFYKKFKNPIVTTIDTTLTNTANAGLGIQKNRVSLIFVARGAVAMTGCVRVNFHDA
jgi:hypothetical protein